MTVLSAAQSAIARLLGRRPAAVVSSNEEINVEITALAQEAAVDIAKAHPWQALTRLATIIGTGSEDYPLPTDYDRMVQGMSVSSPSWPEWFFRDAGGLDQWTVIKSRGFDLTPGWWIILGNRFHVYPILNAGNDANFYYITKDIFTATNGAPKPEITADTDTFVLNERLLTLSLIWRWKAMKQMSYGEDLRLYEDALSQEMARDKGSKVIRDNASLNRGNFHIGWPWELG